MKKVKVIITILITLIVILTVGAIAEAVEFPKFSAKDIEGDVFTNEIFSDSVITIINFWATWNPFSLEEMMELAEAYDNLPGEIEMYGVLMDGNEPGTIFYAEDILEYAGADFVQLLPSEGMESIMNSIRNVPTTMFVDSRGDIVGEIITGACLQGEYLAVINEIIKDVRSSLDNSENKTSNK